MPNEHFIKNSFYFSVNTKLISVDLSMIYDTLLIPISANISSVIRPILGIFLGGSGVMNSKILSRSASRYVYPLGLLKSEQILASILLQAIPALQVNLVTSFTRIRISLASF